MSTPTLDSTKNAAGFLTPLVAKKIGDDNNPLWELAQPLIFKSMILGGVITVPSGFKTDFASVPRIPFVYDAVGNVAREASVVHDYLYTTHAVSRETADAVLKEASAATGVAWWRRWTMWAGVRVFGGTHW